MTFFNSRLVFENINLLIKKSNSLNITHQQKH